MERGKRLLWLVFGGGLVGLAALTYVKEDKAFGVSSLFVWLVLSYYMFRRKVWARWIVVFILAPIGLLFTTLQLSDVLLEALGGPLSGSWHNLLVLLAGVVFLVDAGILTFAEGVGDFFAWVPVSDWSHSAPATPAAQKVQRFQRDELLDASGTLERMNRRARRITVMSLVLGWIIFLGGTGLAFYSLGASFRQAVSKIQAETEQVNDFAKSYSALVPLGGFVGGPLIIGFGFRAILLYVFFIYLFYLLR
jgi:hypothetical protein